MKAGVPWYSEMEIGLQLHEVGEYADYCCRCCYHDDEPEVELRFGPDIFAFSLEHPDEDFVGHCMRGGWRWSMEMVVGDLVVSESSPC